MDKQQVKFVDLGIIDYQLAWDKQEELVKMNAAIKTENRNNLDTDVVNSATKHYLLFCEHPPVYTLGKSGSMDNVLISEKEGYRRMLEGISVSERSSLLIRTAIMVKTP